MKLSLLICFFFLVLTAGANPVPDTTDRRNFLFRGTEYTKIFTRESGSPFLDPGTLSAGWVNYYGSRYDLQLQYDIEDDQVVSLDITGAVRMQLVKQKIRSFGMGNRTFIRLAAPDMFFEQVYHGAHDVLIRWQKVLVRTGTDEGKYKLYRSYYISDGEMPVNIQRNGDLFSYFGKHSKELKDYFHDQKLSMKKDPLGAIVALVSYADKKGWDGQ